MLSQALIITRRELRDSIRDWRIVAPIVILTLIFPWIMNLSTQFALNFVAEYNAQIIPLRLVPFAMMIVGFFPISFSLIIALETFVGEKERNSLEPLLTTPISDGALYLGKLLAAMLLPLMASYLGETVYLAWLFFSLGYLPDLLILVQILLLTTMEALVMVAGAVVVSSHTTSVRAANLLASFLIIPMAFLIQAESIFLFWGQYEVLWYIVLALAVADALLIRTGIRTFNREEILAREIDQLNWSAMWRLFRHYWVGPAGFSLYRLYRDDIPRIVRANLLPIAVTLIVLIGGVVLGESFAWRYPFPRDIMGKTPFDPKVLESRSAVPAGVFSLPALDTASIFWNNVRVLALGAPLGLLTFGSMAMLYPLVTAGVGGFAFGELGIVGTDPLAFSLVAILPHGIFELPAIVLATAFALRLGASLTSPPHGVTAGENMLHALADWVKIFVFVVVPLLLIAAWVESNITLQLVVWFYGR